MLRAARGAVPLDFSQEASVAEHFGLLFACGTYLVLQRSILRLIIGLGLMSHGVNLLLFTMGELRKPSVFSEERISSIPVIEKAPNISQIETMADPLVQALILTAIVISFGVTAFVLIAFGVFAIKKTEKQNINQKIKS